MAMVNMNNLLNMKDSRWLQLEVCREFQRNKCSRPDTECKFAHPPVNVEVQNGRVTACYDSIKGRCNREKPPCKYFHPPLHLKDQLLINGRNHLALKNALMQQMGMGPGQPVVPGQVPTVATNPYLGVSNTYNPYFPTGHPLVSLVSDPSGAQVMSPLGVPQQAVLQQKTYPGMVTYKRPAEKGGVVYPPPNSASAAAYQHLMQLQQPFVPVSSSSILQQQVQLSNSNNLVTGANSTSPTEPNGQSETSEAETGPALKKLKAEVLNSEEGNTAEVTESHQTQVNSNGLGQQSDDEESKSNEGGGKRMRSNSVQVTTSTSVSGTNLNSNVGALTATAVMVHQNNNAAYAAAAQNYHSALAAMNYTGASLQANKAGGSSPASHPASQLGGGAGMLAQYPGLQQHQHQQTQQHQLIQQYQAMAAAAFAAQSQGAFQGQAAASQQAVQLAAGNQMAAGGFPFGMNPYLAALPQIAAAQRAQLISAQQQGFGQGIQGIQQGGGYSNPFGALQLGGSGLSPNLQFAQHAQHAQHAQQQQQQQQALLAAYGQFASRGPVPVVSAAPTLSQQLYIGSPVPAQPNPNGPLQGAVGVKRMRPA